MTRAIRSFSPRAGGTAARSTSPWARMIRITTSAFRGRRPAAISSLVQRRTRSCSRGIDQSRHEAHLGVMPFDQIRVVAVHFPYRLRQCGAQGGRQGRLERCRADGEIECAIIESGPMRRLFRDNSGSASICLPPPSRGSLIADSIAVCLSRLLCYILVFYADMEGDCRIQCRMQAEPVMCDKPSPAPLWLLSGSHRPHSGIARRHG